MFALAVRGKCDLCAVTFGDRTQRDERTLILGAIRCVIAARSPALVSGTCRPDADFHSLLGGAFSAERIRPSADGECRWVSQSRVLLLTDDSLVRGFAESQFLSM